MKNTYFDLIDQSYEFPQEGFDLVDGYLTFHGISLKHLIEKYGTPFRLLYLPRISQQIKRARNLFNRAIKKQGYRGKYHYCYCTKCSHFSHVMKAALREGVHIETSSSFDIDLVLNLHAEGELDKSIILVHNGYKTEAYIQKILKLNQLGFRNSILVLDSISEIRRVKSKLRSFKGTLKLGVRMTVDAEPRSAYYTSRLGMPAMEVLPLFRKEIKKDKRLKLEMLHFFVDSGIKDTMYYWGEFQKALKLFVQLKNECPTLTSLNLGGGFPIRNNLGFQYDYEYMINEIIANIKDVCTREEIEEPDIFTEFGKYTVGESGAIVFSILEQKKQNDAENWYMIDNSIMNTLPDAWSIFEKFILLPINKWDREYLRVNIGGISCDYSDYYNSEELNQQLNLPRITDEDDEPLYIGFFHTGAYQDSISGYGGIKHCLIPAPKIIVIDRDKKGNFVDAVYRNEQSVENMLDILGYRMKESHDESAN